MIGDDGVLQCPKCSAWVEIDGVALSSAWVEIDGVPLSSAGRNYHARCCGEGFYVWETDLTEEQRRTCPSCHRFGGWMFHTRKHEPGCECLACMNVCWGENAGVPCGDVAKDWDVALPFWRGVCADRAIREEERVGGTLSPGLDEMCRQSADRYRRWAERGPDTWTAPPARPEAT